MWHIKNDKNVCREVDELREERFGRIERDRFRREREANEERQRRIVNLSPCLSLLSIHISLIVIHIHRQAKRRENDRNRCAEQCKELMEGVSPLILLYSIVAIALQYNYNTY